MRRFFSNVRLPVGVFIAVAGVLATDPAASRAGATFYTTRSAFDAAEPGLPVQGFASANTFGQTDVLQSAPLDSATNGPVFAAGSILPGISISNSTLALASTGLIVYAAPRGVGTNWFGDSLILSFAPGVSAVGTDVFAETSPGPTLAGSFTEEVFNGSTFLGSMDFTEATGGFGFIGVSSTTPITKVILLYTTDDASTFVNNIAFGPAAPVPEPAGLVLTSLGAGLLRLGIAARRRRD